MVTGVAACAYYNGLYNARQLVDQARVAQREGRRGEARSLWIQAAVKAESVVVKYPNSKYHDDALLVQGLALRQVDECAGAVDPLQEAAGSSADPAIVREARLLLAECWLELEQPARSRSVLALIRAEGDSTVVGRAQLLAGRASIQLGEPDRAIEELSQSAEPEAQFQRAVAYLAAGRVREAASVIDSTREAGYQEAQWEVVLRTIGAVDHRIAGRLVDRLREDGDLSSGEEARLLIADGLRWLPVDEARARSRFSTAVDIAGDSLEGGVARGHLAVLEFRRNADLEALPGFRHTFESILDDGGPAATLIAPFALMTEEVLAELETPGDGGLRLFRRAEEMRDSLLAKPLATQLFQVVAERYEGSAIAPKALLAIAVLDPTRADSISSVLERQYPTSPYTQVVFGRPAPRFAAVEDSLRALLDLVALPRLQPAGMVQSRRSGFLMDTTAAPGIRR